LNLSLPEWAVSEEAVFGSMLKSPRPMLNIPTRDRIRHAPLRNQRIVLTPVEPADGPELWEVLERSRATLQRWLPWVPYNTTLAASQRYAESCSADWDSGRALRFGIRDGLSGQLLGIVGLDNCVHVHRNCDLGYWLRDDACGRGIMTEAVGTCLKFAYLDVGLERVRCAAATSNHRSLAVIARAGFHFEGVARRAEFVDGRWVDHAVFARLATDGSI
jgi:ribosomal-protein-serine acetyltransferase